MKSLFKIISGLLITALLLAGGGLLAVSFLFDPNDYRADIETVIEKQTGRDIRIEGELGLSVFPCCAVEVGRTHLSNPPGFSEADFLSFDNAAVSIGVLPLLLDQRIEVGEVTLEGFDVLLETQRDGSVSWSFADTDNAALPADSADGATPLALNGLSAEGFRLLNARIRWKDATSGTDVVLSNVDVLTGPVTQGEPFDLDASFSIAGLADGMDAGFVLESNPVVDMAAGTATLDGTTLNLSLRSEDLPGGSAEVSLLAGRLTAGGSDDLLNAADVTLNIESGPLILDMSATGRVRSSGSDFSGTLTSNEFSPQALLKASGVDFATPDPDVLRKAALQAEWRYRDDRFALTALMAALDDSKLSGWLRLDSIEKQQIRTDLQVDGINLDRYLATSEESAAAGGSDGGAGGSEELPVTTLRELDMQARFGIGELVFSDVLLSDVSMTLVAKDGRIRINPLMAALYGGGYNADIQLDVRNAKPQLNVAQVVSGIQIGELLSDTSDLENIVGLFETELNASASGATLEELIAGLNGDVRFDLQDAVYQGRDFWYELRSQKARLSGDAIPLAPENPQTDISKMLGSGVIENGVLTNKDFAMQIPFLRVSGEGTADLNDSTVNYQLNAKVVGRPEFDDGSNLEELQGLTLPVTIQGAVDNPDIQFDLTGIIAGLATKKLQERLLKKYGGQPDTAPAEPAGDTDATAPLQESEQPAEKSERDQRKELIRDSIRDLF